MLARDDDSEAGESSESDEEDIELVGKAMTQKSMEA